MKAPKTSKQKLETTCAICLETIQVQGHLDCCKHVYCFKCIREWETARSKQADRRCPLCKRRFSRITRRPSDQSPINLERDGATHLMTERYRNIASALKHLLMTQGHAEVIL